MIQQCHAVEVCRRIAPTTLSVYDSKMTGCRGIKSVYDSAMPGCRGITRVYDSAMPSCRGIAYTTLECCLSSFGLVSSGMSRCIVGCLVFVEGESLKGAFRLLREFVFTLCLPISDMAHYLEAVILLQYVRDQEL